MAEEKSIAVALWVRWLMQTSSGSRRRVLGSSVWEPGAWISNRQTNGRTGGRARRRGLGIGRESEYDALSPHKSKWQAMVERMADDCTTTVTQRGSFCQANVLQRDQKGLH
jgi:hypothetical protein